jgi:hypothetical protein
MRRPVLIAFVIASFAGADLGQIVSARDAYSRDAYSQNTDSQDEHAQDAIDHVKADTFDSKMFARASGDKAYACFVRRYDADHLARHPKQKVAAMKLLVGTEIPEGETARAYSFGLEVKYRHRAGELDTGGYCKHAVAEDNGSEIGFACGVDCDGGGINVALSKDDKSAIIRLERIRIWPNNKPDDAEDELVAGADDRIFRLERADANECAALVTDRSELAALHHK